MKRLSEHGSKGFSTSGSASIRDLGFAMSTARGTAQGKLSVREIAKKADFQVTRSRSASASSSTIPFSTQYSRDAASNEVESVEPISPAMGRKQRFTRSHSVGSRKMEDEEDMEMPQLNMNSIRMFLEQEQKQAKDRSPIVQQAAAKDRSPIIQQAATKGFLSQKSETAVAVPPKSPVKASNDKLFSVEGLKKNLEPSSPVIVTAANARPSDLSKQASAKLSNAVEGKGYKIQAEKKMEKVQDEVRSKSTANSVVAEKVKAVEIQESESKRRYTLAQLRQKPTPSEVDIFAKEDWLTTTEFVNAFGLLPPAFAKLPTWKKIELRKQAKLF